MVKPRSPNNQELEQLREYLYRDLGVEFEKPGSNTDIEGSVQDAAIAVFDRYMSDSPGYAGKLIVIVWAAGPSMYEVYKEGYNGRLEKVEQQM